jgi:hypothetical protein
MRGIDLVNLVCVGLLILLAALLQATFQENWRTLGHLIDASPWERAEPAMTTGQSPHDRLRQHKISEKARSTN